MLTDKSCAIIQSCTISPNLKTITLSLNKINRRNVKSKIDEFSKKNIAILLWSDKSNNIFCLINVYCYIYFTILVKNNACILIKYPYIIRYRMYKTLLAITLLIISTNSIQPRQTAYDFTALAVLPDLSFKSISLSDYAGKYVILLFYPFDFTYVCPT